MYLFSVLALSAAATVTNIKIRFDAKTPQFAIFGTRVICVFYSSFPEPFLLLVASLAISNLMQKPSRITETLAHGYSSESTQLELYNEYQHDMV